MLLAQPSICPAELSRARQSCGPPSCSYSLHARPAAVPSLQQASRRSYGVRASAAAAQPETIQLPQSREEAVSEAASAALAVLEALKASKAKKSFKSSQRKLALEIPVADESPQGVAQLAQEFVAALPSDMRSSLSIVTSRQAAELAAGSLPQVSFVSLNERRLPTTSRCVLLLGLTPAEIPDAKKMLSNSRAEVVLLLNTSDKGTPSHSFFSGFDIAYCFEPVAIKAFVLTTDGVVYKKGADAPWLIVKRSLLGKYKSIGRMQSRPQQQDLEAAFLNAAAVDSPVNRGIGAIKNLVSRESK